MHLFKPRSATLLQSFTSWLTGMPAEFSDPRFPSYGEGREGEPRHAGACMLQSCGSRWPALAGPSPASRKKRQASCGVRPFEQ